MTAERKTQPAAAPPSRSAPTGRKAWVPRSPVQVVLDQITRQEDKVTELQRQLETEKTALNKLLQAKKVLEST